VFNKALIGGDERAVEFDGQSQERGVVKGDVEFAS
jgi:hypothetical protein